MQPREEREQVEVSENTDDPHEKNGNKEAQRGDGTEQRAKGIQPPAETAPCAAVDWEQQVANEAEDMAATECAGKPALSDADRPRDVAAREEEGDRGSGSGGGGGGDYSTSCGGIDRDDRGDSGNSDGDASLDEINHSRVGDTEKRGVADEAVGGGGRDEESEPDRRAGRASHEEDTGDKNHRSRKEHKDLQKSSKNEKKSKKEKKEKKHKKDKHKDKKDKHKKKKEKHKSKKRKRGSSGDDEVKHAKRRRESSSGSSDDGSDSSSESDRVGPSSHKRHATESSRDRNEARTDTARSEASMRDNSKLLPRSWEAGQSIERGDEGSTRKAVPKADSKPTGVEGWLAQHEVELSPGCPPPILTFDDACLPREMMREIAAAKFPSPSPIQS
eukprot:6192587-Pleurochrysis_carterae.AAC.2